MARVARHLGTLRPRSASVATGAAFSDDEGHSDDVRIDELTNGLIRLSVGSGHSDLERRELALVVARLGLSSAAALPGLLDEEYARGLADGKEQLRHELEASLEDARDQLPRRDSEQLQVGITRLETKREAVDVEYEEPEHEKKR